MSMSDDQDDDVTGALGNNPDPTVDPRAPVSNYGADALPPGPGVGINAPGRDDSDTSQFGPQAGAAPGADAPQGAIPDTADPEAGQAYYGKDTADKAQWPPPGARPPPKYIPNDPNAKKGIQASPMVMRYLAGADADPQLAQQAEAKAVEEYGSSYFGGTEGGTEGGEGAVPTGNVMSDSDRRLAAVHVAMEHGGPAAAYAVQQTYRASYAAAMGHAHVALAGSPDKPADPAAAAASATTAASYILDGTNTTYSANPDGTFTAAVTHQGGATNTYKLTPAQFNKVTDIGDVEGGQYDAVHENGNMLAAVAKSPGTPLGGQQGAQQGAPQQGAPQQGAPQQGDQQAGPPQTAEQRNDDIRNGKRAGYGALYDPMLEARASRIFPSVGQEAQRQQWMAKMEQQGAENTINTIKANNPAGVARAQATEYSADQRAASGTQQAAIRAASYNTASNNKMQLGLQQIAQRAQAAGGSAQAKQDATTAMNLRTKLANLSTGGPPLTPEEEMWLAQRVNPSQSQQPAEVEGAPSAPAAAGSGAPTSVPTAQRPQAQQEQAPTEGQTKAQAGQNLVFHGGSWLPIITKNGKQWVLPPGGAQGIPYVPRPQQ